MNDKRFRKICLRCIIFVCQLIGIIAGCICCIIVVLSSGLMTHNVANTGFKDGNLAFLGMLLNFCAIGFGYSNLSAVIRDFKSFLNDNLNSAKG